jgi:spore coat protein D
MYCGPAKVLPAIVHPTHCCVNNQYFNAIQPNIHPSHVTTVNHMNIHEQHYFPVTNSVVNTPPHFTGGPGPRPGMGFYPQY